MSFSYKTLNSTDITLTSYIANKQWEVNNSAFSQNGITIYMGENVPINRNSPFNIIDDTQTSNGEYRRLIYESIKHLYYENYTSGSLNGQFFQSSSYFNYEQSTLVSGTIRNIPTITGSILNPSNASVFNGALYDVASSLYDEVAFDPDKGSKIVVISIDKNIYGSGLSPNSVIISGSTYNLQDDGEGNMLDTLATSSLYIGNVFYSQGLIVITNQDYLCVLGTPPTAVNDYSSYLNTTPLTNLDILGNDFVDCGYLDYTSFLPNTIPGYIFPNYTQDNGIIAITPDQTSVIPGDYKLGYTISTTSGMRSNTGSINLIITSEPLQITNVISSSNCWGTASNSPVTFSINYGVPYYSYSLDNGTSYTGSNNLFNVVVSGSVLSSNNNTIYVKDYLQNIVTQSFSAWYPPVTYTTTIVKSPCSNTSTDGIVTISSTGLTGTSVNIDNTGWYTLPKSYNNLSTGSHNIVVSDINNCITSSTIILTPYTQLTASMALNNISCYGGSNGNLSVAFTNVIDNLYVTLLDPTSSAIYNNIPLSSFANNTVTASNLLTGSYNLNLISTGSNECQSYSDTLNLTSPTKVTFTTTASFIDSCSNALIFNAIGGTPPYTYFAIDTGSGVTFSSDSSSFLLNTLIGSTYDLIVVDNNGCSVTGSSPLTVFGRNYIYSGSNCLTS